MCVCKNIYIYTYIIYDICINVHICNVEYITYMRYVCIILVYVLYTHECIFIYICTPIGEYMYTYAYVYNSTLHNSQLYLIKELLIIVYIYLSLRNRIQYTTDV